VRLHCNLFWQNVHNYGRMYNFLFSKRFYLTVDLRHMTPDLKSLLTGARTIAVVGCSDRSSRTSYAIARYLQEMGYRILPVNPNIEAVHGERAYPTLQRLPDDVEVDIVNIFRHPSHTLQMVEMAIAYAEARGTQPAIWTQLGVSTSAARQRAEAAGLPYVQNRCIMVEHARLVGTKPLSS